MKIYCQLQWEAGNVLQPQINLYKDPFSFSFLVSHYKAKRLLVLLALMNQKPYPIFNNMTKFLAKKTKKTTTTTSYSKKQGDQRYRIMQRNKENPEELFVSE